MAINKKKFQLENPDRPQDPPALGLQETVIRRKNLPRLMQRSIRQYERYLIEELEKRGFGDLRPTHFQVLTYMSAAGIRSIDVAMLGNLTKQTVGQIVTQLEALGYVYRSPDPSDKRAQILFFTERGRQLSDIGVEALAACEARIAAIIGRESLEVMRSWLLSLADADKAGGLPPV